MSHPSLPPAGIVAARSAAARAHPSHRLAEDAARPQPDRIASRQIAAPAPMPAPAQSGRIERAIADASRRTGVDFDFLVAQARIESAMDPEARAPTSSATGLYQFIESTWLRVMQRHGARFGLGDVAARIALRPGGEAHVADPAERRAILAMRRDPEIAALMAAGLAEDNAAHLAPVLGRAPDHSELYLAHFLGAGGAARFLTEMARDPGQGAASLFRRPAAANPAIFFDGGGRERSLSEVMDRLAAKVDRARSLAPDVPLMPPTLIADEAVFAPGEPPALTGARRPAIAPRPVLGMDEGGFDGRPVSARSPLSRTPPSPAPPMSRVLSATLEGLAGRAGETPAIERAGERIRAAYERLKAMGL